MSGMYLSISKKRRSFLGNAFYFRREWQSKGVADYLKLVFTYLAIVNVLDGAATYWGLHISVIKESNPLMNGLYEISPLLFIGYKLFLSGVLYGMVLMKKFPTIRIVKVLSIAASMIYTMVIILHGVWSIPIIIHFISH